MTEVWAILHAPLSQHPQWSPSAVRLRWAGPGGCLWSQGAASMQWAPLLEGVPHRTFAYGVNATMVQKRGVDFDARLSRDPCGSGRVGPSPPRKPCGLRSAARLTRSRRAAQAHHRIRLSLSAPSVATRCAGGLSGGRPRVRRGSRDVAGEPHLVRQRLGVQLRNWWVAQGRGCDGFCEGGSLPSRGHGGRRCVLQSAPRVGRLRPGQAATAGVERAYLDFARSPSFISDCMSCAQTLAWTCGGLSWCRSPTRWHCTSSADFQGSWSLSSRATPGGNWPMACR